MDSLINLKVSVLYHVQCEMFAPAYQIHPWGFDHQAPLSDFHLRDRFNDGEKHCSHFKRIDEKEDAEENFIAAVYDVY